MKMAADERIQMIAELQKLINDEEEAIEGYRRGISLAASQGNMYLKRMLEDIKNDEEQHRNVLEQRQDQLKSMDSREYTATQERK